MLVPEKELRKIKFKLFCDGLTDQQIKVAVHVICGRGNAEIAERLRIAKNTVEVHNTEIYRRLGIHSRCELMMRYLRDKPTPP